MLMSFLVCFAKLSLLQTLIGSIWILGFSSSVLLGVNILLISLLLLDLLWFNMTLLLLFSLLIFTFLYFPICFAFLNVAAEFNLIDMLAFGISITV